VVDAAAEPFELGEVCLQGPDQRRTFGDQDALAGDVGRVQSGVQLSPLGSEFRDLWRDRFLHPATGNTSGEACSRVVGLVDVVVDLVEVLVEDSLVELVGVAAAGKGDVAPLAVERLGAEDVGVVDGESLGFVAGDGVAVGDVAGIEVVAGEDDGPPVVGGRVDCTVVWVDACDGGAVPLTMPCRRLLRSPTIRSPTCNSMPAVWMVGPVRRPSWSMRARARWLRSSTSARRSPIMIDPAIS
jgi:hypothetical protein